MKAIVFVGPKGSGKDTCANFLQEDKRVRVSVPFALPLKRICSSVFDLHHNIVNDPVLKERELKDPIIIDIKHLRAIKTKMLNYVDPNDEGCFYNLNKGTDKLVGMVIKTPRKLLQQIGTEFIRQDIHPDWHCMAAFGEPNIADVMKRSGNRNVTVSVTDCRFLNELDFLVNRFLGEDIALYYIENPEAEKKLAKATHQSELEIIKVKERLLELGGSIIKNDGTLDELKEKLKDIYVPECVGGSDNTSNKPKPGSRFRWAQR